MFPGAFVDGGKKTDEFVVVCNVIKEVSQCTDNRDNNGGNDDF